jgi:hypothetical protein
VLRPALAVARACEQRVDQSLVGIGPHIRDKRLQLFRGRRQAVEIEVKAPRNFIPARLGRGREFHLVALGRDEAVDVAAHPAVAG